MDQFRNGTKKPNLDFMRHLFLVKLQINVKTRKTKLWKPYPGIFSLIDAYFGKLKNK